MFGSVAALLPWQLHRSSLKLVFVLKQVFFAFPFCSRSSGFCTVPTDVMCSSDDDSSSSWSRPQRPRGADGSESDECTELFAPEPGVLTQQSSGFIEAETKTTQTSSVVLTERGGSGVAGVSKTLSKTTKKSKKNRPSKKKRQKYNARMAAGEGVQRSTVMAAPVKPVATSFDGQARQPGQTVQVSVQGGSASSGSEASQQVNLTMNFSS